MTIPIWVPLQAIFIIHDRQITRHGGASGIRDTALVEAAAARPLNKFVYGETHIFDCASAYAYGLSKAHGFVDGNKRTAFVTMATFLRLNGWAIKPDPLDGVRMMENLAQDLLTEQGFAQTIQEMATQV